MNRTHKGERGELAGQRHTGELLAHAALEHSVIEILEWARTSDGYVGGALKDILEHAIVVGVQPSRERRAADSPQT